MTLTDPATGAELRKSTRLSLTVQVSALAVLFGAAVNASGHRAGDPLHAVYFIALAAATAIVTWALSRFALRDSTSSSVGLAALLGALGGAAVGLLLEPISSHGATRGDGSPAPAFTFDAALSGGIVGVALTVASSTVLAHHFFIARRRSLDFAPRLALSVGAPLTLVSLLLMSMTGVECGLGVIAGAAMVGRALWLRARRGVWVERVRAGREAGYRIVDASAGLEVGYRVDASAVDVAGVPRFVGHGEPGGSVVVRDPTTDDRATRPVAVALIEGDPASCAKSSDAALGGALAWGCLSIVVTVVVVFGLLILMALMIGG